MPQIAKDDFDDCVKSILTENWTPAGIMAMRVLESAVRKYYKDVTGTSKKKPWGVLLDDLIKNHKSTTDKSLIAELKYIKNHIRNPLAHPELRIERVETEKGQKEEKNGKKVHKNKPAGECPNLE